MKLQMQKGCNTMGSLEVSLVDLIVPTTMCLLLWAVSFYSGYQTWNEWNAVDYFGNPRRKVNVISTITFSLLALITLCLITYKFIEYKNSIM